MPVTQRRRSAEDERLHDIAQNPDDPKRRAVAEAIFAAIESRDTPIAADARLLADHALAWAALGFSARARAVFRRWR
jgi:predicted transcriptional regulator